MEQSTNAMLSKRCLVLSFAAILLAPFLQRDPPEDGELHLNLRFAVDFCIFVWSKDVLQLAKEAHSKSQELNASRGRALAMALLALLALLYGARRIYEEESGANLLSYLNFVELMMQTLGENCKKCMK